MPNSDPKLREQLTRAKRGNVGNTLIKLGRVLKERTLKDVRARGFDSVRMSHGAVLPHIDLEGTRISVLAERLEMTVQGAGKLVTELEALKLAKRSPDPSDGRARLVRLTESGFTMMFEALDVLEGIERELAKALGEDTIRSLHDTALEALAQLEGSEL